LARLLPQDIPHTFPNHPWLQSPVGQEALRRVLSAYSVHNTRIGYCRAMNNIVAVLLVRRSAPVACLPACLWCQARRFEHPGPGRW
jgi:hypothetical protein